jgi:hypothetical protein
MLNSKRSLRSLLMVASLATPVVITGCAARVGVGYRVYDPYYRDYHVWDDHETVYYGQWAGETHREPHREFRKLNRDEQKEYWNWRHNHPDKR